jgi:DNA-binding Lrp family transcriptional regulator
MNIPASALASQESDSTDQSEKTLEILNLLASQPNLSQRDIASASGMSLGMVNLVLRRLAKTGYLKIVNLDGRKMRYLLTAKGIANKSNRAYEYVLRSVRTYNQLLNHVEKIISNQIKEGKKNFVIDGNGEIADLVAVILNSKGGQINFRYADGRAPAPTHDDEVTIKCNIQNKPVEGISVLETLILAFPSESNGGHNELE